MGVEGVDRLQPPCLAFLALGLRPYHWLPVGRENEAGASIREFHAIAGRLVDVEEERPLYGVLVGAGFNVHAVAIAELPIPLPQTVRPIGITRRAGWVATTAQSEFLDDLRAALHEDDGKLGDGAGERLRPKLRVAR